MPPGVSAKLDLERILATHAQRTVQRDWTIRWRNHFVQLPAAVAGCVQPGDRVTGCQQLDGSLRLFYKEREWAWSDTAPQPVRMKPRSARPAAG